MASAAGRVNPQAEALDPLATIQERLALSDRELAVVFSITAADLGTWREAGIPAERAGDVGAVLRAALVLDHMLKPGRAAQAVRRAVPALGGRTVLAAMSVDPVKGSQFVLDTFDLSRVQP